VRSIPELFALDGRVAIVTGGSRGLGEEMAEGLAEAGAALMICARRKEWLTPTLERFTARGFRVDGLVADVSKSAEVQGVVDRTMAVYGRLDILVNNAGLTKDNLFMVMKDEQWDDVIAVNLTSTFMLMRAAARAMMRAKTGYGRIINISSVSGVIGNPGQGNYAASKAGIIGMTKSLAREVGSRGITANCIAPGFIKTAMTDALNEKQTEEISKMIPAQRFGTPDDIALGALYLASDAGGYITGQTLHINGGMLMV